MSAPIPVPLPSEARVNAALRMLMAGRSPERRSDVRAALRPTGTSPLRSALAAVSRRALGVGPDATFGPYRVEHELGRGGQAIVHRAVDTRLGRAVALKRPGGATPASVLRFEREARIGASLRHRSLCAVFEAGEIGGTPYLASELLTGPTLADCVREHRRRGGRGPVDLPGGGRATDARLARVLDVVRTLADAVDHVHERGFVHRDIKPANVAFSADRTPVLFDFGVARAQRDSGPLDHAGFAFGTPGYTAPELLLREGADPRLDVWALGVLLLELLTGGSRTGMPGRDRRCAEICGARIDAALHEVVSHATAADPRARFPSAAAFAAALATVAARHDAAASTVRGPEPVRA